MPRSSARRLALILALATPAAAQQLVCVQQQITLRPGESTCITVSTLPAMAGIPVLPSAPAGLTISPSIATSTGGNGEAEFQLTCSAVKLTSHSLVFTDTSGQLQSCSAQVTCDQPELRLGGIAGSYPGTFQAELVADPPVTAGQLGIIAISATPGPLPMSIINPGDPRTLWLGPIGLTILPGFTGPFLPPFDRFAPPAFPVPNVGNTTLWAQGLVADFSKPQPYQRLSQPAPITFRPTDSFDARAVAMNLPRSFHTILRTHDGLPMVAGGGQGGIFAQIATDQTDVYHPETDTFVAGPRMTMARSIHTATELPNGKWLIAGGVDVQNNPTASAELYDPATASFTAVGDMNTVRTGHTATLLPSGDVLIVGGLSVVNANVLTTINSALASAEIFHLDASGCHGTFTPVAASMSRGRAGHAALTLPDGRIYIVGGVGPGILGLPAIWTQTEFFDPTTQTFSNGPAMPTQRAIFPMTEITQSGGPVRYLAAGGLNSAIGLGAPTADADVYTFQSGGQGSWARAGSMMTTRAMFDAYRFGDDVYHFGGLDGNLVTPIAVDTVEIYNIPTGSWRLGPTMTTGRGAYASYLDPWGQIHFTGGAAAPPASQPPVVASDDWYFR